MTADTTHNNLFVDELIIAAKYVIFSVVMALVTSVKLATGLATIGDNVKF